ncbi:MAG: prolyl oligopeptidase family serine peptidase [Bacteroidales bacterium]
MKKYIILLFIGFFCALNLYGQGKIQTDTFTFVSEGKRLSGILDMPIGQEPSSIVIIVQGYGKSNIVAGKGFDGLRTHFVQSGLACCVWDKPGCGKSEGDFDINQTVQSSAKEVIAAIEELKHRNIPASTKIGLWGISRAGWICPLVIQEYPSIAFWISVSGTDDKENFPYLLESNLRIEGRGESQIKTLVEEWYRGNEVFRSGGSVEEYLKATQNLQKDSFCISNFGYGGKINPEEYMKNQSKFINEHHTFDEKTGLMIYVPNFQETLNKIQCPVLAIFGEKDTRVDWRKTIVLYKETIGKNQNPKLTIKTFPDGDHGITKSKTGGIIEKKDNLQMCDGYYEIMITWLKENGFGK